MPPDGGEMLPSAGRLAALQCRQISRVQHALISVLRTHYEHAASISALQSALEMLAPELAAVVQQTAALQVAVDGTAARLAALQAERHNATAARRMLKLTGISSYREATAALSQPAAYYRPVPTPSPRSPPPIGGRGGAPRRTDVQKSLSSLRLAVKSAGDKIAKTERKTRGLRRALHRVSDTVTQLAALHKAGGGGGAGGGRPTAPKLLEHFIEKQTEINVNLLKRIRNLEERPIAAPTPAPPGDGTWKRSSELVPIRSVCQHTYTTTCNVVLNDVDYSFQ